MGCRVFSWILLETPDSFLCMSYSTRHDRGRKRIAQQSSSLGVLTPVGLVLLRLVTLDHHFQLELEPVWSTLHSYVRANTNWT